MSKNIIFYFSGTGNCLHVAKETAQALSNCEIVSMSNDKNYHLAKGYERIGFVYPTYFLGIPLKVHEFVSQLNLAENQTAYYYAITTCGRLVGNALPQLNSLLIKKQLKLDYATKLVMFANYVVLYKMSNQVAKITQQSNEALLPIINDIKNKQTNKTGASNPLIDWYYHNSAKKIPTMDENFNVADDCISCGICREVCPVKNIELIEKKPTFKHHCEQCMACLQFCPQRAINYKSLTQKRGRYTHPSIGHQELATKNNE